MVAHRPRAAHATRATAAPGATPGRPRPRAGLDSGKSRIVLNQARLFADGEEVDTANAPTARRG
ncbi:MAG: hypothetical protein KDC33_00595 [Thermoleophilia bacterium]|nr:hypothetical protein [Thermoleophilia bacterium]